MKQSKKVLSMLLVMVLALSMFVGCSSKISKDDPILGEWSATEMAGMNLKDLGMDVTMTVKDDGTATISFAGEETSSTWKKDGDKYIFDGDDSSEVVLKDDVLSVSIDGDNLVFERKQK